VTALAGRLALVTGASRGIGAAVAEGLTAAGATVVRVARSLDDGWHDGRLDIKADVSDAAQAARMAVRVRSEAGLPDIVVQSAGGFLLQRLADTTPAEFDEQVRVNLRGAFLVARELLPPMAAVGRGTYVSVGSVADHTGFPENAAYAAAKAASETWTLALADRFKGTGAAANIVVVGAIVTPAMRAESPDKDFSTFTPAEEIAEAIAYLCSDDAASMNGQRLTLRGAF